MAQRNLFAEPHRFRTPLTAAGGCGCIPRELEPVRRLLTAGRGAELEREQRQRAESKREGKLFTE